MLVGGEVGGGWLGEGGRGGDWALVESRQRCVELPVKSTLVFGRERGEGGGGILQEFRAFLYSRTWQHAAR